jgi:hypothetical protein
MQETWNLFTGNDIALALVGFIGFFSVVAVLRTAFRTMDQKERRRSVSAAAADAADALEDFLVYETLYEDAAPDSFDHGGSFDFDFGDD